MGFFKLHQPKKYGYRPIYYDPKKEAQKEREKRMADAQTPDESTFKTTIQRGSFRQQATSNGSMRRYQSRKSNIRLAIIMFIILALLYYFLY